VSMTRGREKSQVSFGIVCLHVCVCVHGVLSRCCVLCYFGGMCFQGQPTDVFGHSFSQRFPSCVKRACVHQGNSFDLVGIEIYSYNLLVSLIASRNCPCLRVLSGDGLRLQIVVESLTKYGPVSEAALMLMRFLCKGRVRNSNYCARPSLISCSLNCSVLSTG
jgi:hypothetical protein